MRYWLMCVTYTVVHTEKFSYLQIPSIPSLLFLITRLKSTFFFVYFKATPTSPQDIFLALISGITSGRIRETIWDAGEESSYVQVKTISTVLYCFGLLKTLLNEFLI